MSFTTQLNWRYATKKFDGSHVSKEKIDTILNSIRMAPTSYGLQPFHVTVVTDPKLKAEIRKVSYDQEQVTSSSHLLVFSARTDLKERIDSYIKALSVGDTNKEKSLKGFKDVMLGTASSLDFEGAKSWAGRQAYIALGFGLAACAELGVDSCPMEGFSQEDVKKVLKLDAYLHPLAFLAIGKRDTSDSSRPKFRFSESDLFDVR